MTYRQNSAHREHCTGSGRGQAWDPFRPTQRAQLPSASEEGSLASGGSAAYTRKSSSKLVLQSKPSDAEPPALQAVLFTEGLNQSKQAVPSPKGHAYQVHQRQRPAMHQPRGSSDTVKQGLSTTAVPTVAASSGAHSIPSSLAASALQSTQPIPKKPGSSRGPGRNTWKRQTGTAPISRQQCPPHAVKRLDEAQSHGQGSYASSAQQRTRVSQQQPRSPKFTLRRVNQLVRLTIPSTSGSLCNLTQSGEDLLCCAWHIQDCGYL